MTLPDAVREQYESLPYPPRNPALELKELKTTFAGQLKLASSIFWGGARTPKPGFRALDAGCGTGDSAIFLAEQLRASGGTVVGFDLSEASLAIAKERAERRGLDNVSFIRGRIEDLPGLGLEPFDFIVSFGVLHHLPDPASGLAALTRVLGPNGGMALMVYAELGRTAIYHLQRLFRITAPPVMATSERLDIVKRTLNNLSRDHWASLGASSFQAEIKAHGDAGLFDLFLHSQDRAYTVPQVRDWLSSAGMGLLRFDMPILYDPSANMPGVDVSGMDEAQRQELAELLNGRIKKHTFFAARSGQALPASPAWDDESAIPSWLTYDPSSLTQQVERRPDIGLAYEGVEYHCALDGFRRDFL
ncbi:MAG: class I SAM-dependent methyltransferase, partial [bacterium]